MRSEAELGFVQTIGPRHRLSSPKTWEAMPEAFWIETSRFVVVATRGLNDPAGLEPTRPLPGQDERDVGQVGATGTIAPALHAEQHGAVVERGFAIAVVDPRERLRECSLSMPSTRLDEAMSSKRKSSMLCLRCSSDLGCGSATRISKAKPTTPPSQNTPLRAVGGVLVSTPALSFV